ncbi:hypothetical protein BKA65DRAFT_271822 [Rhexocercosporidium sp. MPI-PUGE-AT-0058]|nr:hypothetical protein BKA65DRAFT_271822 [Rhexocercosporidium sp. MPI-PUGE-AT-0058]
MKTKQTPDQGVYNSVMRRDFNATLRDNGGSICHKDLLGLDPEELVNDEIIKVYTAHLLKGHQSSEIFVANTFLYERIVTWRGKDDEDASVTIPKIKIHQKWVSIFDQKYFVVPVHQNGNHWKLAILVNMPSMLESDPNDVPTIFTVDSMDSKGNESNQDLVNTLKEYVCKSAILSKCDAERRDIEWVHATSATQQENEYDCGIFTLMYLEMFIRNPTEFLRKVEKKQRIETPDATVTRRMIKDTLCKLVYNTLQAKELSVDDETSDDDEILELPLHAREEMKTTIPFLKQSPIHQLREATEEEQKVLSKQPSPSSFGLLGNQSEALHLAPLPLGMDGNQDAAPGSQPQPPNAVLACQDDPQRPEASATPTIPPRKRKRSSSIPRSRPRLTPCYTPSTIEDTEVYTQSVTSLKQQFELLFEKLCSQQTSATEALATLRQEKADSPAKIRQIEAKIATETEERSLSLAPYDFLNRKKRIRTLRADEYDELARLEKTLELSFLKILALQDEKADVIGRDVYVDELIVQEESRLEMLERDIAKIEKVKGLAREMTDVWSGVGGGGDWV